MKQYDIIVIGGGVNGCGVARDAALRGLKVLLLEKNDFSAGTTWASSGMIHGGVRYLFHDVETTKRACEDSGYIQKIAPHLLFRIPFLAPMMRTKSAAFDRFMLEGMKTFFEAYDAFQPMKRGKPSLSLNPEQVRRLEPMIQADISGAASIDEWGIDCPRLCLLNALDAAKNGADVYNHAEVVEFIKEGNAVKGVTYRDKSGRIEKAEAKLVVNASGPWSPKVAKMAGGEIKLRPAKGVHVVFPGRVSHFAVIVEAADKRQMFIMPHENTTMIGTTDDDFYGDPDDIPATLDEVRYLIQAVARFIPAVKYMRPMRVISAIRPTIHEWGKLEDALTREHEIIDHAKQGAPGMISLIGGKLASYRVMSEETVDVAMRMIGGEGKCSTHISKLPGGDFVPKAEDLAAKYGVSIAVARRLSYRHGSLASEVLELMKQKPQYRRVICECEPVIEAEIRWAIRSEMAYTIGDITRRTRLGDGPCQGRDCVFSAGVILGEELGMSEADVMTEIKAWHDKRRFEQHAVLKSFIPQTTMTQASFADLFKQAASKR